LSEQAYDAGSFPEVDFEFEGDPSEFADLFEVDLGDGQTTLVGDPEALRQHERAAAVEEIRAHEVEQARAEVAESFPDLPPALLKMLDAPDAAGLHELAATVAARLGIQSVERHPGATPDPVAQMEGDALSRAQQYAKKTGDMGPVFRLREAEALARSGRAPATMSDREVESVRAALAWARRSGDQASVAYLSRQLGGR
jgi:hypothetical protein